jgi:flagellar biosynthesis protein FlhF
MQVKKFEAPTLQEALDHVKRELGPEAVILQTKKYKKGLGLMSKTSVEVTAAISQRAVQKKSITEKRLPKNTYDQVEKLSASRQAEIYDKMMDKHLTQAAQRTQDQVQISRRVTSPVNRTVVQSQPQPSPVSVPVRSQASTQPAPSARPITQRRYIDIPDDEVAQVARSPVSTQQKVQPQPSMLSELEELKSQIRVLTEKAHPSNPVIDEIYETLTLAGVDRKNAQSLIKKAEFEVGANDREALLDRVAQEIMDQTEVLSWLGTEKPAGAPRVLVLVGPTGVGKTTTLAKIASEAVLKRGWKVGLINLDSYKVAAFDQLATYSRILKVPFRSVASKEDLSAAVSDFQGLDLVLVDTTGRSQRDPAALQELHQVLSAIEQWESALVLSATTRDAELHESANRFHLFTPRGLIFSKLDEATSFGCIFNVSQKSKLPLLYFATGQRVPEDIEESTPERLTSLILDLE